MWQVAKIAIRSVIGAMAAAQTNGSRMYPDGSSGLPGTRLFHREIDTTASKPTRSASRQIAFEFSQVGTSRSGANVLAAPGAFGQNTLSFKALSLNTGFRARI